MAKKENKGGNLSNEQVEQDNKVKGRQNAQGGFEGSQDTGDSIVRPLGDAVQREDGRAPDHLESEEER